MRKTHKIYLLNFLLLISLFISVSAQTKEAMKLQEFNKVNCDEYLNRMDIAIAEAQNNPTSTIYVFVYEGVEKRYNSRKKKTEAIPPIYGTAKAKIDSMKKWISEVRGFSIENFIFLEAGFRESPTVEFWLVPVGAKPPKPSPTLEKIKYRKGKAKGFCLGM